MRRVFAALAAILFALFIAPVAYAGVWVSTELADVPADQLVKVAEPKPVQLLFQFQTNGAPNARAIKYLKDIVTEDVKKTGAFSEVTETPAPNGAILSITINDVFNKKEAESKGFGTGLTFGLKGTMVADEYEATADYISADGAPKISAAAHHKIITVIGIKTPPTDAVKVKNADEGAKMVTAQLIAHLVNDISKNPAFSGAPAQTASSAAPAAEAAPAALPTPAGPPAPVASP